MRKIMVIFLIIPILITLSSYNKTEAKAAMSSLSSSNLYPVRDELETFSKGGKFGYINQKGEIVIIPQFDQAWNFNEGLAGVGISGKFDKEESYVSE